MRDKVLKTQRSLIFDDYCLENQSSLIHEKGTDSLKDCEQLLRTLRSSFDGMSILHSVNWDHFGLTAYLRRAKSRVTSTLFPSKQTTTQTPHFSLEWISTA